MTLTEKTNFVQPKEELGEVVARLMTPANSSSPPISAAGSHPSPSASVEAVAFLKALDADGWHNLVSIDPAGKSPTDGRTFAPGQFAEMAEWIDARDGKRNLYYTANEPKPGAPHKSLEKEDIGAIRAVYADVDLPSGVKVDEGLRELQKSLQGLELGAVPPSFSVDSGGGIQLLWKLDQKYSVDEYRTWAEEQGRGIARLVEGDPVQNINRLMRLAGTVNIPTPAKLAKGRVKRRSSMLRNYPERAYSQKQLADAIPGLAAGSSSNEEADVGAALVAIDMAEVQSHYTYEELPADLRGRFETARNRHPKLNALWHGDESVLKGLDKSTSTWRAALASQLSHIGGFDAQDYANLAWAWGQADRGKINHRQLARDWGRIAAPNIAKREALLAKFFEDSPLDTPLGVSPPFANTYAGKLYPTLSIGDLLAMPDPVFVIDRHLPEQSLGFLYGEPGAKKSFLALDWALHLAFGLEDWHGDPIKAKSDGVVLYLAGEGVAGMKDRLRAWLQQHEIAESDPQVQRFQLLPHSVNLMQPEAIQKLAATIRHGLAAPVIAVVVDTVSRAMPGADENLQKDMTRFVQACDTIKQEFRCIVLGVHHAAKSGAMRGSTVLHGAGDFVFRLDCKKSALAGRLHCEKQKDAPDGWSEAYRFEIVHFGDGRSSIVPARLRGSGSAELTQDLERRILDAIAEDWNKREPWAKSKQAGARWAPRRLHAEFGIALDQAEQFLDLLESARTIEEATVDRSTKRRGYRVAVNDAELDLGVFQ